MKRMIRLLSSLTLSAVLFLGAALPSLGAYAPDMDQALSRAAAYLAASVPRPQVSSIGGEWAVLGLSRCGQLTQEQRQSYLANLSAVLQEKQGVLSQRKYSEFSRVVLTLTALGENPASADGYDLLSPLLNCTQVERQGINGPIFALLALNSGNYPGAEAKERYLQDILQAQGTDGGWSLAGRAADPDVTSQALQALAPYEQQRAEVARAVQAGLSCLEQLWAEGAFLTSESCSQAMIAYSELNRTAPEPLVSRLLSYQCADGSFLHHAGGKSDPMSSEQALCALTAVARQARSLSSFYDMSLAEEEQCASVPLPVLLRARPARPGPAPKAA